jgi:hypothetical protein
MRWHTPMLTEKASVSDSLAKQALAIAERQKAPVCQIVALALSAQLAFWKGTDTMAIRAQHQIPHARAPKLSIEPGSFVIQECPAYRRPT